MSNSETNNIPFYNFKKLHSEIFLNEIKGVFSEIIENSAFVEGKYNTLFEQDFAKLQGASTCILVANGTDAIEIALQALNIPKGSKVGIPGISFYATAEAVINVGLEPVFIDVDPKSGLISVESFKRILKQHKLQAIIPVHIYGQPAPIEELQVICNENNIKIIEDAAQAQGAYLKNGPVGSSPNLTTFSFYPTKNLGAFGDAGAILFNNPDEELKARILSIRNHGRSPNGHTLIGRNSRCDHLQAAVLYSKLKYINKENEMRKNIAKSYFRELKNLDIRLVPEEFITRSSWHLFPIGLKSQQAKYELKKYLGDVGISSSLFYEKALPEEKPLTSCAGEKEHSLFFAASTLCLPMNPFLTEDEIKRVAQKITQFFRL